MDTNLTQNWLGLAALLVGVGALIYAVWQGKATSKNDDANQYADRLERIVERDHQVQRETIEALRAMTEEMRRTREEQFAMHRDDIEVTQSGFRELRDVLWDRFRQP